MLPSDLYYVWSYNHRRPEEFGIRNKNHASHNHTIYTNMALITLYSLCYYLTIRCTSYFWRLLLDHGHFYMFMVSNAADIYYSICIDIQRYYTERLVLCKAKEMLQTTYQLSFCRFPPSYYRFSEAMYSILTESRIFSKLSKTFSFRMYPNLLPYNSNISIEKRKGHLLWTICALLRASWRETKVCIIVISWTALTLPQFISWTDNACIRICCK